MLSTRSSIKNLSACLIGAVLLFVAGSSPTARAQSVGECVFGGLVSSLDKPEAKSESSQPERSHKPSPQSTLPTAEQKIINLAADMNKFLNEHGDLPTHDGTRPGEINLHWRALRIVRTENFKKYVKENFPNLANVLDAAAITPAERTAADMAAILKSGKPINSVSNLGARIKQYKNTEEFQRIIKRDPEALALWQKEVRSLIPDPIESVAIKVVEFVKLHGDYPRIKGSRQGEARLALRFEEYRYHPKFKAIAQSDAASVKQMKIRARTIPSGSAALDLIEFFNKRGRLPQDAGQGTVEGDLYSRMIQFQADAVFRGELSDHRELVKLFEDHVAVRKN